MSISAEASLEDLAARNAHHLGGSGDFANAFPGGYWKDDLVDHVLLVNLYFPPEAFFEELQESAPRLIGCYPSPHNEIARQIGSIIGQDPNRIVACSGISELLPVLLGRLNLSVAVPVPSFNPYEYIAGPGRLFRFELPAPLFDLDVDSYADHVIAAGVDAAVVVSPNNPTSRAVSKEDLLHLAARLAEVGCLLMVDESFVEFAPAEAAGSLEPEIDRLENVIVLKSLGKIYGVCGLRLGYMLTADKVFAAKVRELLPPWNVGSFAEFFLTRLGDYRPEVEESWRLVREDRDQLAQLLLAVPDMQVLRPHANFVFCHLPGRWPDGQELVASLLERHRILIRHSGGKTLRNGSRYLRIAARTAPENRRLVEALQETAQELLDGSKAGRDATAPA